MLLIVAGALLIICGMVVATISTLRRGRLSQARQPVTQAPRDTLEPAGKGRRLSLKSDMPGLALILLGALLLFLGAA